MCFVTAYLCMTPASAIKTSDLGLLSRIQHDSRFWDSPWLKPITVILWKYNISLSVNIFSELCNGHFTVHCQRAGLTYHCKLFTISDTCGSVESDRPLPLWFFFYCSIRRQSKALLNGSSLEFLCYCVENLFSLKPTALYSASPPAYKHCGTLHCGSSLPINLYLSASVELRAFLRCYSSGSISKARPSPLHLILSMARFFFIHSSAASLSAFIFIACIYA